MTHIGLVGGEPYERDLLREWLGRVPGAQSVVAIVDDGPQRTLRLTTLDLIVCVVDEDDEEPLSRCAALPACGGTRPVVAVLRNPTQPLIRRVAAAGASAIVAVGSGPKGLAHAVLVASQGGAWLDPALSPYVLRQLGHRAVSDNDLGLTPKEHEVALRFPRGMTNREIASELGVSDETVKSHVRSIYGKLGVTNRSAAAAIVADRASIASR